ncbi:MAG: protein phosphatase 2C domain-containing protein [Oscillospiraceae bacterium]|jgi:protein phosphatase|nr:protein phosphatase 2C domain-containing protein [Oscillospiraceae bacterium]
MNALHWRAAVRSETGSVRANNEDNFYFNGRFLSPEEADAGLTVEQLFTGSGLFAVFDGLGGYDFGERASFLAASLLRECLSDADPDDDEALDRYFAKTNRHICREAARQNTVIGSTAVLAFIKGRNLRVCNVGDSRAYLLREETLTRLSLDHTVPAPLHAKNGRGRQLTQHLGIPEEEFLVEPHSVSRTLQPGDKLLLCSDGLTDMVSEDAIRLACLADAPPLSIVQALVDLSLSASGRDNVTVLLLACHKK